MWIRLVYDTFQIPRGKLNDWWFKILNLENTDNINIIFFSEINNNFQCYNKTFFYKTIEFLNLINYYIINKRYT